MAAFIKAVTQHLPNVQTTAAAPVLAATLGVLGLGGGGYTYLFPLRASAHFGTIPTAPETESRPGSSPPASTNLDSKATVLAYLRMHGARNATFGLVVIALSAYALSLAKRQQLPDAAAAVRKCLGIVLLANVPVLAEDGRVLGERVQADLVVATAHVPRIRHKISESDTKKTEEANTGRGNDRDQAPDQAVGPLFFALLTALVGLGCLV